MKKGQSSPREGFVPNLLSEKVLKPYKIKLFEVLLWRFCQNNLRTPPEISKVSLGILTLTSTRVDDNRPN